MPTSSADDLFDKALKRREELQLEIEALDKLIETYRMLMNRRQVVDDSAADEPRLFKLPSKRAAHAEKIAEMIDAARRIIIAKNQPMKRGELREEVEAAGYKVTGNDKNKVFGTNLWRSGKFRMIEGKGYWPIDAALPSESRGR
ncbi:hypothetical protein LH128_11226 [Sphingomonas sp. LH128]|uniref:hypothetical protein n=1 Tax=Sphingomonas sp. LH128 TaxID=473781 RepID=UPI00027C974F|nr:hypothetical protein [Sphingomonas sp. LH128]EJU12941.1 hypothetical protein LH128_11226 [Sphingomonas sp. LH128]